VRLRRYQRGFLLNPYRFEGTVQEGAIAATSAASSLIFGAASIATADASASADASMIADTDQAASGVISMDGEGLLTMEGAAVASAAKSAIGTSLLTLNPASDELTCDAADYDGSTSAVRSSALTGQADSKDGIFSAWVKPDNTTSTYIIFSGSTSGTSWINFSIESGGKVAITLYKASTSTVGFLRRTVSGVIATTGWYHILAGWKLGSTEGYIYVNDVEPSLQNSTTTDVSIEHSGVDTWSSTQSGYPGGYAEVYFAPGQYLDFSIEENRRKFISADGKPVSLGATGSTPTGTVPLVYQHLGDGEAAANFAVNRSGAGNLTVSGTLTTYATSPSD
jgi:hypothetical protein